MVAKAISASDQTKVHFLDTRITEKNPYYHIRTVSEMVEEHCVVTVITKLIMGYLKIPYCRRTPAEQEKALTSPLTNVVWFEDFFSCNVEGFVTRAVNPYTPIQMQHFERMIRQANNQPDSQDRIFCFKPEKVIVNGEEKSLTIDLMEKLAKCKNEKISIFTGDKLDVPFGAASCYSITKKVYQETRNKTFKEQEKIIAENGQQSPSASQVLLADLGWHAKSGEYLHRIEHDNEPLTFTWTTDTIVTNQDYLRVFVGAFYERGITCTAMYLDSHCDKSMALSGVREYTPLSSLGT